MSDKAFRPWEPDQQMLFPASIKDFVPAGHLALFVRDLVRDNLDLSAISPDTPSAGASRPTTPP